jgi:hypothetical protein
MIKAGLLEVADDVEAQHPGLAWKLDGEAVFLRITDAGRAAIGSEAETTAEDAQETPLTAPDAEPVTILQAPPRPPRTRPRGCRTARTRGSGKTPPTPRRPPSRRP